MDKQEPSPQRRVDEPVVPATPDGTVPYTDPLPTPEADAAAPDRVPGPTRMPGKSEPVRDDRGMT